MNIALQYICLWLFGFFALAGFLFWPAWLAAAMALGLGIGIAKLAPDEADE